MHRFEGTINQYTGDGVMALFGAPLALEDHAERACACALALREPLRQLAHELRRAQGVDLALRMGLHSGEVVVGRIGDDLRMDYTAQGPVVGTAQRIEQLAEAGRPYLSEATARLVEGYFALEDQGELALKGVRGGCASSRSTARARCTADSSARASAASRASSGASGSWRRSRTRSPARAPDAPLRDRRRGGSGKSRLCFELAARARAAARAWSARTASRAPTSRWCRCASCSPG